MPSDPRHGSVPEAAAPLEGEVLWTPSEEQRQKSNLARYMSWLASRGRSFADYAELWHWSVSEIGAFWQSVWDYFGVVAHDPPSAPLEHVAMPGTRWFPGATLNYAEHALRQRDDRLAVIAVSEQGRQSELSYAELGERVARTRAGLQRLGVARGDRVVGVLPNTPDALVAFLATASLGAIWSCCSPEFGVGSVLDRFRQIAPKVLFAADGYHYGGKSFDRLAEIERIQRGLPSLEHTIIVSVLGRGRVPAIAGSVVSIDELTRLPSPLEFTPVPFDHPLWILYSSGTTGLPKPIVQGHGGILLEHFKALSLHCDLGPNDRFFWFTTTGWMMWNFLISGLLCGSTLILYDGSPGYPDLSALWRLAAREQISYFGTSAPFLLACKKAELSPGRDVDLSLLRAIGTTGAPLPVDGFKWVYEAVGRDLLLGSVSGGTDVCTAFVASCPLLPVRAGELQCRALGAKVLAFDEQGRELCDEVGELVLTEPLPSMPVFFWGDESGERYRDSYFGVYPGVWRHGDWIKITPHGGAVIYGRSDSTLNRGGVRMGSSEFYRVVEALPEVADSLVVDTGSLEDSSGKLWLFLVLQPGVVLDGALSSKIKQAVRRELSPRHVPDEIALVAEIPRTLNGKKLEVPIKRILTGTPPDRALNRDTLANPNSIEAFVVFARSG